MSNISYSRLARLDLTINKLFFPHDSKTEHFKALDGLRGVAVLIVILSHSSNENIYFHEYLNFQRMGTVGVYLFFVLSAYLLDRQIALAFINHRSSRIYWKNYFLRRFLRIYPLFFLALMVYGFLSFLGYHTVINSIDDFFSHLFLLRGESVFWSIPVEFKYYFISPLIMWFFHKVLNWDRFKLFIAFTGIILSTIIIEIYFNLPAISTVRYFPIFIAGTLISVYELLFADSIFKNSRPNTFNLFGIISLMLIIITIPYYFKLIFGFEVNFQSAAFYFPYACAWGLLLLSAKYGTGLIRKIFELRFLRFIGSISFSMYLFHVPILDFVGRIDIPNYLKIYVFILFSIAFSVISYLFIERPLSRIRINSLPKKFQ